MIDWLAEFSRYKDALAVLVPSMAIVVGLTTWILGQVRESRRKKFETFSARRDHFRTHQNFNGVFALIHDPSLDISSVNEEYIFEMAGFLEEIALLAQSRVIELNVASYFFGWYAVRLTTDERLVKREMLVPEYWRLLYSFAAKVSREHDRLASNSSDYIKRLKI